MDYKFEVSEKPAQPTLSIRTRTKLADLPQVIGQAYGAIFEYLNEIKETPAGAPFTAYYNLDMEDLDVEMGFPVAKQLAGKDSIKPGAIPAGKQLAYLYKGSYQGMAPVYEAMAQWMQENGYTPVGTAYEFYFNTPGEIPESELLTRIMFPLK